RSLREPSPLMSDPTMGVYGAPDVRRPIAVISIAPVIGYVTVPSREWRRSKLLVAHSRTLGSPAVLAAANPWDAAPDPNDDWSRARVYVYDSWNVMPRAVRPPKPSVTCFVSDCRSEPITSTWPNAGCSRESAELSAPVDATIESAGT